MSSGRMVGSTIGWRSKGLVLVGVHCVACYTPPVQSSHTPLDQTTVATAHSFILMNAVEAITHRKYLHIAK